MTAAMLFVGSCASVRAENSKTELQDVLYDAGFTGAQAACPVNVFASELSSEDMAFLTEVVKEIITETRRDDLDRKFSEPEKSYLLAEIMDTLPFLGMMSKFGNVLAADDFESRLEAHKRDGFDAVAMLRIQNAVTQRCSGLFEDPYEGYYLTLEDGEARFNKRADVQYDASFYGSPAGLAQCIKVFRGAAGFDPNEGFDENKKADADEGQIADAQRALFLTKKLIDALEGDTGQAGDILHRAEFFSDAETQHKCRASFPDWEMLIFLTEQMVNRDTSFITEIKAAHAAERAK